MVRSVKTNIMPIMPTRNPADELLRCPCLWNANTLLILDPLRLCRLTMKLGRLLRLIVFCMGTSSGINIKSSSYKDDVLALKRQWKKGPNLADLYWRRWLREIVTVKGDIVIIVKENGPRTYDLRASLLKRFLAKMVKFAKLWSVRRTEFLNDQP